MYEKQLIYGPINESETKYATVEIYKYYPDDKVKDCYICTHCKWPNLPECRKTCLYFEQVRPYTKEELNLTPPEGAVICKRECKTCILSHRCPEE